MKPRPEFIGKYSREEICGFAERIGMPDRDKPVGFSVASAMIEQLLAEHDANEGYPGIAHDFELCKAHLRHAAEIGAGTVNPDTVAEWKRAASLPNAGAESSAGSEE